MKSTDVILQEVRGFSPRERAAAIAHYVYMLTAERVSWAKRVPTQWHELGEDAKEFNMAAADTWAAESELYSAWLTAVQDMQKRDSGD
jgi:hypothetical protein